MKEEKAETEIVQDSLMASEEHNSIEMRIE